jgi:hypothetical protein
MGTDPVANGTSGVNGVYPTNIAGSSDKEAYNRQGWKIRNAQGYEILEKPYGSRRPLRVIHIGAGASGIVFSKFLEEQLEDVELQVYEKNHDVGGTWLENRCAPVVLFLVFRTSYLIHSQIPRMRL